MSNNDGWGFIEQQVDAMKRAGTWGDDRPSSSGGYPLIWDWGILGPIAKLLWWLTKFFFRMIFRR